MSFELNFYSNSKYFPDTHYKNTQFINNLIHHSPLFFGRNLVSFITFETGISAFKLIIHDI
jgi:hypothetical protein